MLVGYAVAHQVALHHLFDSRVSVSQYATQKIRQGQYLNDRLAIILIILRWLRTELLAGNY